MIILSKIKSEYKEKINFPFCTHFLRSNHIGKIEALHFTLNLCFYEIGAVAILINMN